MKTYVILLRGVTPTGRNRVPMAELRGALAAAGLVEVRTYIQSGNVIARSGLGRAALESLVHEVIGLSIGADITVIARSPEQLRSALADNPFAGAEPSRLYFSLLAAQPEPALLCRLLETDVAPERVAVVGDTLYTLYATKLSDSRFTNNFFERKLKVAMTTRNFNTMTRLVELSEANHG